MSQIAYFGAGCYWNSELIYAQQDGVMETEVGWATFPGDTSKGDVEVVKVTFDPESTSYDNMVDIFWSTHNPSNPKNADDHYVERSVILFVNKEQKDIAQKKLESKNKVEKVYSKVDEFKAYRRAPAKDQKYYFDQITQ